MGLLEKIFGNKQINQQVNGYFKMMSAYSPVFTNFSGSIYEMELTRSAIHSFATHCSKLKPEYQGNAYKALGKRMQFAPNPYMDTAKFIYRIATILSVNNTAFIVPIYDESEMLTGYYPILPTQTEIVEYQGEPYLRYRFANGQTAAIEMSRVGIMTQHQYSSDIIGEDNAALNPTLNLITTQNQGIVEGVKQSAAIRFLAKLAKVTRPEDIAAERKRFIEDNLSSDNNGGVMLFDTKYEDVKQIDSKPFVVDAEQMTQIKNNVYNYFGTNEAILQNKYTEDEFNAFYEGKIEPFAIQLSLVLSNMTFTDKERQFGNQIFFSANRLQYASNQSKISIVTQLFDRGFINHDMGLEVFNMPPLPDGKGQRYFIRKEYAEVERLNEAQGIDDPEIVSKEIEDDNKEPGIPDNGTVQADTGKEN